MLTIQTCSTLTKLLSFMVSILLNGRVASFLRKNSFSCKDGRHDQNILRLHQSTTEVNCPNDILGVLSYIESLSPAKRPGQRVGCILQSNNSILATASNTFVNNVGVHAEMIAISKYLRNIPIPDSPVMMTVSFSPCVECAAIIKFIPEIKEIQYIYEFEDNGSEILRKADIIVRQIAIQGKQSVREKGLKLHSYSKFDWNPEVTHIVISLENLPGESERKVVLAHSANVAFDIRPFIILALRRRENASSVLCLSYTGRLNHREKLFVSVMGILAVKL